MKNTIRLFLLASLCLFANKSNAQRWEFVNPKPTNNPIEDILFTDALTGFICGSDGTILKTTDGGVTWVSKFSGTPNWLYSISFPDAMTGFMVGQHGTIVKTTDGGETWSVKSSGGITSIFYCVSFPDADTGYISTLGDGLLLKTVNGGESWNVINVGTSPALLGLKFVDANKGYAYYNENYFRTLDGGVTWNIISYFWSNMNNMFFLDPMHAYACGENSLIFKTENAGTYWDNCFMGNYDYQYSKIFFTDLNNGYAFGGDSFGVKTSDGGNTWTDINSTYPFPVNRAWMITPTTGFIFHTMDYSFRPFWARTTDGFNTCNMVITGPSVNLMAITSPLPSACYAVGDSGVFLKSVDHGNSWTETHTGTDKLLRTMHFRNAQNGFVAGDYGIIMRTTNEGHTWTTQQSGTTMNLLSISFIDQNTGICTGAFGTCLRTADGGNTWSPKTLGSNLDMNAVQFVNPSCIFIGGDGGQIYKSTDGGLTFSLLNTGIQENIETLYFIDEITGFAGGRYIYKTSDGGQTWKKVFDGGNNYAITQSICFRDALTGYAATDQGLIALTLDAGENWIIQLSGTSYNLHSICTSNDNYTYTAGERGSILRTTDNNVGYQPVSKPASVELHLFPNPAKDIVNIETLNFTGTGSLQILNMLGKVFLSRQFYGNQYKTDLQNIPQGIYIVQLKTGNTFCKAKLIKE